VILSTTIKLKPKKGRMITMNEIKMMYNEATARFHFLTSINRIKYERNKVYKMMAPKPAVKISFNA
jgi:hypothetical protein